MDFDSCQMAVVIRPLRHDLWAGRTASSSTRTVSLRNFLVGNAVTLEDQV